MSSRVPKSAQRKAYTEKDDFLIMQHIRSLNVKTPTAQQWKEMEQKKITEHSWESMKNRYSKILQFQMNTAKNIGRLDFGESAAAQSSTAPATEGPSSQEAPSSQESSTQVRSRKRIYLRGNTAPTAQRSRVSEPVKPPTAATAKRTLSQLAAESSDGEDTDGASVAKATEPAMPAPSSSSSAVKRRRTTTSIVTPAKPAATSLTATAKTPQRKPQPHVATPHPSARTTAANQRQVQHANAALMQKRTSIASTTTKTSTTATRAAETTTTTTATATATVAVATKTTATVAAPVTPEVDEALEVPTNQQTHSEQGATEQPFNYSIDLNDITDDTTTTAAKSVTTAATVSSPSRGAESSSGKPASPKQKSKQTPKQKKKPSTAQKKPSAQPETTAQQSTEPSETTTDTTERSSSPDLAPSPPEPHDVAPAAEPSTSTSASTVQQRKASSKQASAPTTSAIIADVIDQKVLSIVVLMQELAKEFDVHVSVVGHALHVSSGDVELARRYLARDEMVERNQLWTPKEDRNLLDDEPYKLLKSQSDAAARLKYLKS